MSSMLVAACLWLHSLATVIFIGHYVLMALIYQPALEVTNLKPWGSSVFREIARRSRPWLYAALVVFMLSGVALMFVDPEYLGIGNFANAWSWLMLVKHVLVVGMIAAGFWFNGILKVGSMLAASPASIEALARHRLFFNGMALAGVLVLLLTALAQAR